MKRSVVLRTTAALLVAALSPLSRGAFAQVADRITAAPASSATVTVERSVHGLARSAYDVGRAPASTPVQGLSLSFTMSATQKANLQALLAAQQTAGSPQYHQWLTPAQFAAQFGASAHDLSVAEQWLTSQGLTVTGVSGNGLAVKFQGTVAQVEAAFHTEMHRYTAPGQTGARLANSTAIQLPAAFSGVIDGVRNLAQFRPVPLHTMRPSYTGTSNGTVEHYLTPADIATIYGINGLYSAGYKGDGQTIAILGQTAINTTDINNFRSAAGLSAPNLTQTLVPNTGASQPSGTNPSDEAESDLDIEWSGAIAPNATINFVYVGNGVSTSGYGYSVFDSLSYAIEERIAPIVSMSYGGCEPSFEAADITQLEATMMQASSQGQTVFVASGDAGATGCDQDISEPTTTQGLAVNYPASSAYATGVGGTEFNEGSGSYWNSTNSTNGGSATGYIPETTWNESQLSFSDPNGSQGPSGSGGGASVLFGKPSWQVATGVPSDGARDVPDISLDSAANHDSYIFCTPNSSGTADTCANGFAGAIAAPSLAGGTSFAAPITAAIMTLVNQKVAQSAGATGTNYLGNINPVLYSLYGTAPNAFNDVTTGNNAQPCLVGTLNCTTGYDGYSAGVGYDQATGLGSINAYALASAFPNTTEQMSGSLIATTTNLTVANSSPITGAVLNFFAALNSSVGVTAAPTGTITLKVDGNQVTSDPVTAFSTAASNASVGSYALTYNTTSLSAGSHTLVASYSGDGTYAPSSSTLTINVIAASSQGAFTLSATNLTVASGGSGNSTVTVTSQNGYTGTVNFSVTTNSNLAGCYTVNTAGVPASGTGTATITIYTSSSAPQCATTGLSRAFVHTAAAVKTSPKPGSSRLPMEALAGGLLCVGLLGRRRKHWPMAAVLMLVTLGTAGVLSGCGGGSSGTIPINGGSSSGTYTLTVTGEDGRYTNLTASTNFTLTIQ